MGSDYRTETKVFLVTAHGRQTLSGEPSDRVIDILNRNGVPWSAVSVYVVPRAGGEPMLQACLDTTLSQLAGVSEVLLYFNRNVNPFLFSLSNFKTIESANPNQASTEYFYQRLDNVQSSSEAYLKKLSPEECRTVIADRVADIVRSALPAHADLMVGVSGGGDSNALLYGLSQLRDHGLKVHPVIVKGIPDWDSGVPRAQALCQQYGLKLEVIEEQEVKALIGLPSDATTLIDRFEREFPGDDFEFLGTLLIRLALSARAKAMGTCYICTGLNLEDVLCEAMYRVSSGLQPAAFPARVIGDLTLIFPLWLCPKRIIDGCFPRYSRENYDARYPCFSLGRNLYYSLVYTLQSQFPGFAEHLAQGFSELGSKNPVSYTFDEQLGFHVERFIPLALRQKFQRMLGKTALASND